MIFDKDVRAIQWRKGRVFTGGAGEIAWVCIGKKMNCDLNLILYTKINLKWIIGLNILYKISRRKQKRKHL